MTAVNIIKNINLNLGAITAILHPAWIKGHFKFRRLHREFAIKASSLAFLVVLSLHPQHKLTILVSDDRFLCRGRPRFLGFVESSIFFFDYSWLRRL
ncbi:unnamed protein product [Citrullus colocynthis]|uniref:Uncharacterized protein n=1 Tax=Citrullus colocynthis TaxID=252529 RepID=A0ABP0ZDE1_9ROSI